MARYRRGEREQVWREVIRDQAASGLSISAFCRDRKLSPASFFNRRRKLAERESASVATVDARTDDGATDRSSFDCHGSLNVSVANQDGLLAIIAGAAEVCSASGSTRAAGGGFGVCFVGADLELGLGMFCQPVIGQ